MTNKKVPPNRKNIYMDVDGVVAELFRVWISLYNSDFDDNLTYEGMTDWNIHKLVKPECGYKIYDYLKNPALYDEVVPEEGSNEAIDELRSLGYRVMYTTSSPPESAGRKFFWLKDWKLIKDRHDYVELMDKSILRGRYMLDDAYHNVHGFMGYGYLRTRPWNKKFNWYHRVSGWDEFLEKMRKHAFSDAGFSG